MVGIAAVTSGPEQEVPPLGGVRRRTPGPLRQVVPQVGATRPPPKVGTLGAQTPPSRAAPPLPVAAPGVRTASRAPERPSRVKAISCEAPP